MAQQSFNDYVERAQQSSFVKDLPQVGFFSLKNDGDEAIVRIFLDDTKDLDVLTTHSITVNGKYRKVNCLRESATDDMVKCPLCNAGVAIQTRIFIKLIRYDMTENGVVANPVVWERPISFGNTLRSFIQEYGPLSESIFKVKRRGAAGDRATSYDLMFVNQAMYPETTYKKDFSAFNTYKALGRVVMDKTFDEVTTYVATGTFPERAPKEDSKEVPTVSNFIPPESAFPEPSITHTPAYAPMPQATTQAMNETVVRKPTRYY